VLSQVAGTRGHQQSRRIRAINDSTAAALGTGGRAADLAKARQRLAGNCQPAGSWLGAEPPWRSRASQFSAGPRASRPAGAALDAAFGQPSRIEELRKLRGRQVGHGRGYPHEFLPSAYARLAIAAPLS
jgi:hypothetical protein